MEEVVLLYASNRRLEGWGSLDFGGPVELLIWRSVSSLETAPMWVSPTQHPFSILPSANYFTSSVDQKHHNCGFVTWHLQKRSLSLGCLKWTRKRFLALKGKGMSHVVYQLLVATAKDVLKVLTLRHKKGSGGIRKI